MNKTAKRILYSILILVIIFIIAYPKIDFSSKEEVQESSGQQEKELLTVDGRKIELKKINYEVRVTGSIIADESVDMNSEVSAKVDNIHFKEGQQVKRGQLLVTLNADELSAEIEKEKFTKKLTEDNEYRQRKLLEKEAISREEYEIALTTLNTSLAEIKLLETRKAKHEIKAPFDGKIGLREVSIGAYINPGDLIARVYNIESVKIDFSIPGRYLKDINPGDKIEFTVDAYDEVFEGRIYAIEPQIDPQTRSIKLRATCPNPQGKLLPGQFAKINLILDEVENSIVVPTESVIPELNGQRVFVLSEGKVESRSVKSGIRMANEIQIVEGLNEGDIVITSGLLQIRNGMEVNVAL